jgi:predicted dehydrogenase
MSDRKIGVAIVGTGFGRQIHIPAFQYHHRTEVVAIYHRDRTKLTIFPTQVTILRLCLPCQK